MSAASAPVRSCSLRRSPGSSTTASTATIVPVRAPCDTERRSFPEHRAVGVDDACRVEHLAAREAVVEAAGEPEGHDLLVGQRAGHRCRRATVRAPVLRAARSSVFVAQASVIP